MMAAPLILVAPSTERAGAEFADWSVSLSNRYSDALIAAGGLPQIMPATTRRDVIAEAVRRCDGVLHQLHGQCGLGEPVGPQATPPLPLLGCGEAPGGRARHYVGEARPVGPGQESAARIPVSPVAPGQLPVGGDGPGQGPP